ncbi:enoyl-CoA hydratase-related protein [Jatrophihabitans sp. DSM 45814]
MDLERRREGSVEILTLNRPEQRNALNPEMLEQLSTAFAEAKVDDGVRVVILTAAGDKAFCAGMDLKAFAAAQSSGAPPRDPAAMAGFTEFSRGAFGKPVIAAVNATAVAGGFELVMNCDLVVTADQAKFGIPEVKRGLYAAGGGYLLPARIPLAVALELGLTGDFIDAERALQLGLVNRVVPAADVLKTALELAARISENGPLGVLATKKLMRATYAKGVEAAQAVAAEEHDAVFKSEDALEGARAFGEKRTPQWKGR